MNIQFLQNEGWVGRRGYTHHTGAGSRQSREESRQLEVKKSENKHTTKTTAGEVERVRQARWLRSEHLPTIESTGSFSARGERA